MNKLPIKLHPINQEYDSNHSISIIVYMIDKCNYSCEYCINKFPRTLQAIDVNSLFNFLRQLYEYTRKKLLIELAGGEPMCHPNLLQLLHMFAKSQIDYHLSITTNFSYPFDSYKRIMDLVYCDFVFSYHIVKNNIELAFNNFLDKLAKIDETYHKKCCIRILYNNMYTNHCLNAFNTIYQLYNGKIRIEFCQLLSTQKYSSIYSHEQMELYNDALVKIIDSNTQNEYLIEYDDGTSSEFNIYDICVSQTQVMSNFQLWRCDAGYSNYYIHCDGAIYPCANYCDQHQKPLASIYNRFFNFKMINKPIICLLKQCRNEFPLNKERLVK